MRALGRRLRLAAGRGRAERATSSCGSCPTAGRPTGSASRCSTRRRREPDALPLVLTHGWPGSVVEFLDVIEPLATRAPTAAIRPTPSTSCARRCPATGSATSRRRRAGTSTAIADAWAELMTALGYDRFGAQGGDWGAAVTTRIGHAATPTGASASTSTWCRPDRGKDRRRADRGRAGVAGPRWTITASGAPGYSTQQSTRPQTLGYGLVDSPAGQAAWIVEKFWAWTDCEGHPEDAVSPGPPARQRDALLAARRRGVVGPAVLGELRQLRRPRDGRRAVGHVDLPEARSSGRRGAGPSAASPTSGTGTSSTRRPLRRLRAAGACSSTRSARSSAPCASPGGR